MKKIFPALTMLIMVTVFSCKKEDPVVIVEEPFIVDVSTIEGSFNQQYAWDITITSDSMFIHSNSDNSLVRADSYSILSETDEAGYQSVKGINPNDFGNTFLLQLNNSSTHVHLGVSGNSSDKRTLFLNTVDYNFGGPWVEN